MAVAEVKDDECLGGEREWTFRGETLVVRTYEDFVEAAIGGVITAASVGLARLVADSAPENEWRGLRCVELGSGCGLVSSTLARLGAQVFATDLEPFVPHLEYNLSFNPTPPAEATPAPRCLAFDWGDLASRTATRKEIGDSGADAIFAANCIYGREIVPDFLGAVAALAGPTTLAFMTGIPNPPDGDTCSMVDAFLDGAPVAFDLYLVAARGSDDVKSPLVETVRVLGEPAAVLGSRHGLTGGNLADGVWLMLPAGAGLTPPAWLRPILRLLPPNDQVPAPTLGT